MSESDLVKELKSGQSLDDVAKAAGVSHDDLVTALKKNMPSELAQSGDADQIAETVATQKGMPTRGPGGPGGAGGPQGPPPPPPSDEDSLLSSLKAGSSLTDLVSSKGISSSALAGVLQDGLLFDAKA